MRIKQFITVILGLVLINSCATTSSRSYKLRSYEQTTLENGLQVIMVQDSSLPYFSMQLLIKAGSTNDPITKNGLANLVARTINKSTKKYNAVQIADQIGLMGSELGASASDDYTMMSSSALSENTDKLLEIFSEVLLQPTFETQELDRQKSQVTSEIAKMVDNPSGFASVVYSSFIYGAHPYGRSVLGTARDVKGIRREDVVSFYEKYYRPNNAILAVTGDFDSTILNKIKLAMKDWQRKPVENVRYPMFPKVKGITIKLVDKMDLAQSQIRIGHKSIKRDNPDFLKLRLANIILGGGFSSRLMTRIRKDRGLTYNISSSFGAEKDFGTFTVATFTRHEKVGETLGETLEVLRKIKSEGVTQAELDMAKAYAKGTFPRAIETAESLSSNLLLLRHYGIGDEYLVNYYKNIDSISLNDVNNAIRNYLDPENLKVLIYAPQKSTIEQLRPIGLLEVEDFKGFIN